MRRAAGARRLTSLGVLRLDDSSTTWQLSERTVVGRSPDADITLNANAVSRRHFEIEFDLGVASLRDLDSQNGTAVNGVMIDPGTTHRLADNDRIVVAGVIGLVFRDPMATPTVPRLGRLAGVWIDPNNDDVWVDARPVDPPLSPQQLRLLKTLDAADGAVVSRSELIATVWEDAAGEGVTDDSVTALVKRLRQRLRDASPSGDAIEIVRGHGIRIVRTPPDGPSEP